jgi:hypothetical protein
VRSARPPGSRNERQADRQRALTAVSVTAPAPGRRWFRVGSVIVVPGSRLIRAVREWAIAAGNAQAAAAPFARGPPVGIRRTRCAEDRGANLGGGRRLILVEHRRRGSKFPIRAAPLLVRGPRDGEPFSTTSHACILAWMLRASMKTQDVTNTVTYPPLKWTGTLKVNEPRSTSDGGAGNGFARQTIPVPSDQVRKTQCFPKAATKRYFHCD